MTEIWDCDSVTHVETPTKKMKLNEFLVGNLYKELKIYSNAVTCVPLC